MGVRLSQSSNNLTTSNLAESNIPLIAWIRQYREENLRKSVGWRSRGRVDWGSMKGVYSRSGEGFVGKIFDSESIRHVQKVREGEKQQWKRKEDVGEKKRVW